MNVIKQHKNMVHAIAYRFRPPQGFDYDDLVQIGYIGLWKASRRFVEEKGTKFSTYAYATIKNEITHFIRTNAKHDHEYLPDHFDETVSGTDADMDRQIINTTIIRQLMREERWIVWLLLLGYTQREIADVLGLTQPNICQRIRRLRVKYKKDVAL